VAKVAAYAACGFVCTLRHGALAKPVVMVPFTFHAAAIHSPEGADGAEMPGRDRFSTPRLHTITGRVVVDQAHGES
jgi:hypothetical protein